jgi:membrane associated rhomboid family serine protease
MTSGADLFVVCKQCGSEVSPYITECPYCGNRLRRRAPKLPRVNGPSRPTPAKGRLGSLLGSSARAGARSRQRPVRSRGPGRFSAQRPYATIALVTASCAAWIVFHAEPLLYVHMVIFGSLGGDWWKLFTNEFAGASGTYTFVAVLTLAIFGWLLEARHGPVLVLALFFGAGAVGALVASAVYAVPIVAGGNAAALAMLAAWAAPDLRAARAGAYYEGDLIGTGAIGLLLLAMPFALRFAEASWLAGVTGGALGLLVGLGVGGLGETHD